jgi:hypothetical protein
MSHIEEPKSLLDSVATYIAVLSGLLWTISKIKRTKILEKHVTAHRKTLVEDRP